MTQSHALTEAPISLVLLLHYSNEINNLGRPLLGHYCFILNLSDPCSGVDNKRRNIACTLYDHAPAQEHLLRR